MSRKEFIMAAKKRRGPSKKGRGKPKCRPRTKKAAKPFDPTVPIKATKQEAFCQNIVNGGEIKPSSKGGFTISEISATEAYAAAGYKASPAAARRNASRLLTKADIRARIDHLRAEQADMLAEKGVASREECCQILTQMIRSTHSDFLTMGEDGVTMYDIGPETINQPALKKVKTRIQRDESGNTLIERQFDEIELESKISAIKCLADIMGFNKADENEHDKTNVFQQLVEGLVRPPEVRTPQTG